MMNCEKTVVYKILKDTKSNGVSDWLEKASTQLIIHSLAPQPRKLQPIDELFLATKRGFKRLCESGIE